MSKGGNILKDAWNGFKGFLKDTKLVSEAAKYIPVPILNKVVSNYASSKGYGKIDYSKVNLNEIKKHLKELIEKHKNKGGLTVIKPIKKHKSHVITKEGYGGLGNNGNYDISGKPRNYNLYLNFS